MRINDICDDLTEHLDKIFKDYLVNVEYDDNDFIVIIKPIRLTYFVPNVVKEKIVCFSFEPRIIFKLGAYDTPQLDKLLKIYDDNKAEIENNICYSALEKATTIIEYIDSLKKPLTNEELMKKIKESREPLTEYLEIERLEAIKELNNSNFKKDDKDKLQYDLLPPRELAKVVEVLTLGANKYGKDNWKLCNNKSRYINAIFRHLEAYRNGEILDKESNINHFAHIACNALFMLYFDMEK